LVKNEKEYRCEGEMGIIDHVKAKSTNEAKERFRKEREGKNFEIRFYRVTCDLLKKD
jgi:hypothetical protein